MSFRRPAAQLPPQSRTATRGRLDVVGAVLVMAATGTLTYALIRVGDKG
ncbi:hypothetical protein [Streptomyces sp. NBC_00576]|nr:hypothetical protein [Streptomyces sp. NBC_00576]WUB70029.1 hypothetical protein OG734_08065 [Streptomyces sp. NBC_00576]